MPSDVVKYLSLDEAIAIHERLIDKFGGTTGLRDKDLLESTLFRPQTGYYEDLAQMAAALFESLINNHAFVDGNMRVAYFFCDVYLRLNGWRLRMSSEVGHTFIVGSLENGRCDYDHILPSLFGFDNTPDRIEVIVIAIGLVPTLIFARPRNLEFPFRKDRASRPFLLLWKI